MHFCPVAVASEKLGLSTYTKGKLLADEAVERIIDVSSSVWDKVTKTGSVQHQFEEKYEAFLLAELERLRQKKSVNDTIKEKPEYDFPSQVMDMFNGPK